MILDRYGERIGLKLLLSWGLLISFENSDLMVLSSERRSRMRFFLANSDSFDSGSLLEFLKASRD